jgi:hypothetical protein
MRSTTALLSAWFAVLFLFAACSDSAPTDAEPFDTLKACYDEHHNVESLTVQKAIVVCCLDHPIAGVHPSCQNTQADCVSHVQQANLDASATDADITTACATYISQK